MHRFQGHVIWGTARPSVWCHHHTLPCSGPILQVSAQNSQQGPGSHGAPGVSRVHVAVGRLWSAFQVNFGQPPQGAEEAACHRLWPSTSCPFQQLLTMPARLQSPALLVETRAGRNMLTSAEAAPVRCSEQTAPIQNAPSSGSTPNSGVYLHDSSEVPPPPNARPEERRQAKS